MATPRITQQFIDVIRGDTAVAPPAVRVTQQFVDVMRGDTAVVVPSVRVTQQFVDVIRGDVRVILNNKGLRVGQAINRAGSY